MTLSHAQTLWNSTLANKLCIPQSLVKDSLVWEIHVEGPASHFDRDKTIEEVECQFY